MRFSDLQQPEFDGPCCRLHPVAHAQFLVNIVGVGFDAANGDRELCCDLLIGEASNEEAQEFAFPRREWLDQRLRVWLRGTTGGGADVGLRFHCR